MTASYAPHRGHHSTSYATTWLRRRTELGPLGCLVCRAE